MEAPVLLVAALGCLVASAIWARSALRLERSWRRIREGSGTGSSVAADLARSAYRKEVHNTLLYAIAALIAALSAIGDRGWVALPRLLLGVPIGMTIIYGRRFIQEAGLLEERASLERKAEETLSQEQLAPRRWAARLAPQDLPAFEGFEVGRVYEAGTGLMAGDFYDLFPVASRRLAAVIGDVSGHGIEPSITAFQVKYLLRIFLRQYRDPAQALEELNAQISTQVRQEEFVSLCVAVVDEEAGTLRWASAGHPPAWMWHDGEVRPLRSTGPMLTLDDRATYLSREIPLDVGDLLLLYTDGLAEARAGGALFGEDRIAAAIRRDPGIPADVLCKSLLAAARDFATAPLSDDVAILAIRRV
ncbi:MAG TPA: PP2C family protein-serine/threonine phosphatase [Acidimicrobiales bacterium]|nr:PP2C family protein-serine/threonine phosphatase [Acidimicrobiales bacterium]